MRNQLNKALVDTSQDTLRLLYKQFYETDALKQQQNKFGCTSFAELCAWDTQALPQIFRLF